MAQPLEHEQADLALGGRQLPALELAVDGFAETLQCFPRLGPIACRLRTSRVEIDAEPRGQSFGREKFPPQGNYTHRRQRHDETLERQMTPGNPCLRVGGEVDPDEDGDRRKKRDGERDTTVSDVCSESSVQVLAVSET